MESTIAPNPRSLLQPSGGRFQRIVPARLACPVKETAAPVGGPHLIDQLQKEMRSLRRMRSEFFARERVRERFTMIWFAALALLGGGAVATSLLWISRL